MPYFYRVLTANCGNDAIGENASKEILKQMHNDGADFYVINCQECDIDKTLKQLQTKIDIGLNTSKFKVAHAGKMLTNTKGMGYKNQGITSFIIYNHDEITISESYAKPKRRSDRFFSFSAYNKGGLVTDWNIKKKSEQAFIHIQAISGHLDSFSVNERNKDWKNLHQAISKPIAEVQTWEDLVEVIPHLRLEGSDRNTRNLSKDATTITVWDYPNNTAIRAQHRAPFGGERYSRTNTYKTHLNIADTKDKKREGEVRSGSLDWVSIADGDFNKKGISIHDSLKCVKPEGNRDHDVIFSPSKFYNVIDDFSKVKGQLALALANAAPPFAGQINALQPTEANKTRLLRIYQMFLSSEGLLQHALQCEIDQTENNPWLEWASMDMFDDTTDKKFADSQAIISVLEEKSAFVSTVPEINRFYSSCKDLVKDVKTIKTELTVPMQVILLQCIKACEVLELKSSDPANKLQAIAKRIQYCSIFIPAQSTFRNICTNICNYLSLICGLLIKAATFGYKDKTYEDAKKSIAEHKRDVVSYEASKKLKEDMVELEGQVGISKK